VTPVDESKFALGMVDHDVMRFDIAMHDTITMSILKGLGSREAIEMRSLLELNFTFKSSYM
jgi:hypothetical protein